MQLPATLTLAQASAVLRTLDADLQRASPSGAVAVDASALASFDSSAIALLLELQRQARARGVELSLLHPPAKLAQLAALYGVDGLLGLTSAASR